jgi:hypothetical protein
MATRVELLDSFVTELEPLVILDRSKLLSAMSGILRLTCRPLLISKKSPVWSGDPLIPWRH